MSDTTSIPVYAYQQLKRAADLDARGRHNTLGSHWQQNAYDWLEHHGLVACTERKRDIYVLQSDYVVTPKGHQLLATLAADGEIEKTIARQTIIKRFIQAYRDFSIGYKAAKTPAVAIGKAPRFHGAFRQRCIVGFDDTDFDDATRLLGGKNHVQQHSPIVDMLVLKDTVKLLPTGDVLHHVHCIVKSSEGPQLHERWMLRSHLDDVWIHGPTERAAKLRHKKHVAIAVAPPLPAEKPMTEAEKEQAAIDDAAMDDMFL